ncbi:MAG: leucyl aminopeptidase [Peptostreptococcaceae bacterium]|nr:leucyl aminopeptidase [Peptostreptococcaceae bacterium]
MKIQLLNTLDIMRDHDAYVIPFTSDVMLGDFFDEDFKNMLQPYIDAKLFEGKKDQLYSFTSFYQNSSKHVHIILIGLGDKDSLNCEITMNAFGKAIKELQRLKADLPIIMFQNVRELANVDQFLKATKAMYLAEYSFEKYQTKPDKLHVLGDVALFTQFADADKCLKRAELLAENIVLARNLVNEPANVIKPADLATLATEALAGLPVDVKVRNKSEIEKLGMKAYLAVAQGSSAEPRLIVMNYQGNPSSDKKLALVGKGLTFDSGGYSIKPTDGMMNMKTDMAGSAAVIGAIRAIAQAKLKINVVAVVAAAENMISGHAYLPGDIIGSMAGKTIEIVNTDAEGRLTLIDAVTYAIEKENATKILDIATLTGAVLVSLGTDYAGVVTNNEEFYQVFEKASKVSSEKTWRLPLDDAGRELNKSKIADLKNSGGRFGGSQVAGAFIGEFVQDLPWIHVDIAGTSDVSEDKPYCRRGATGYGVELLFTLASML